MLDKAEEGSFKSKFVCFTCDIPVKETQIDNGRKIY